MLSLASGLRGRSAMSDMTPNDPLMPMLQKATHAGALALARELYPRVSTILRDMDLVKPYPEGVPAVEWGRARGTAVHLAIKLHEEGMLDAASLHKDVAGPFAAYLAFKEATGYKPQAFEEPVYHDTLRYRGTLDSRGDCDFGGGPAPAILDLKCSKQPDLEGATYQLAAYAIALDDPWPSRYVIQLNDESYRIHDVTSGKAVRIFEAAAIVWHAQREGL